MAPILTFHLSQVGRYFQVSWFSSKTSPLFMETGVCSTGVYTDINLPLSKTYWNVVGHQILSGSGSFSAFVGSCFYAKPGLWGMDPKAGFRLIPYISDKNFHCDLGVSYNSLVGGKVDVSLQKQILPLKPRFVELRSAELTTTLGPVIDTSVQTGIPPSSVDLMYWDSWYFYVPPSFAGKLGQISYFNPYVITMAIMACLIYSSISYVDVRFKKEHLIEAAGILSNARAEQQYEKISQEIRIFFNDYSINPCLARMEVLHKASYATVNSLLISKVIFKEYQNTSLDVWQARVMQTLENQIYFETLEWVRVKKLCMTQQSKLTALFFYQVTLNLLKQTGIYSAIGSLIGAGLQPEMTLCLYLKNILWLILSLLLNIIPASGLSSACTTYLSRCVSFVFESLKKFYVVPPTDREKQLLIDHVLAIRTAYSFVERRNLQGKVFVWGFSYNNLRPIYMPCKFMFDAVSLLDS